MIAGLMQSVRGDCGIHRSKDGKALPMGVRGDAHGECVVHGIGRHRSAGCHAGCVRVA